MKFLQYTLFIRWSASFVIAMLIFGLGQPTFAQIFEEDTNLAQYLITNNVEVGSETVNGYQQVYYIYNGSKIFITDSNQNSTQAVSDKEYITFSTAVNGAGQIFLYHIPSNTTIQITSSSTNLQPKLSNGKVVWERWVEDRWQVFFFDGISVHQLTSGNLSINPDIKNDQIVYASNNEQDEWRTVEYSLNSKQAVIVKSGLTARYPKFKNNKVVFELEELLIEKEKKEQAKAEREAKRLAEEDALVEEIDTIPPVITLNGEAVINLSLGNTYTEEGATALDNVNGLVPVIVNGYPDTSLIGIYTIHYNTTDSSNNDAIEVLRTINVTVDGETPQDAVVIDPSTDSGQDFDDSEPEQVVESIMDTVIDAVIDAISKPDTHPSPEENQPVAEEIDQSSNETPIEIVTTEKPDEEPTPVTKPTSEPTPELNPEPESEQLEPVPEPVVEEDIIVELEGEPLVQEEIIEEEAVLLKEPATNLEPELVEEPTPEPVESTPTPESTPEPILEPESEPTLLPPSE